MMYKSELLRKFATVTGHIHLKKKDNMKTSTNNQRTAGTMLTLCTLCLIALPQTTMAQSKKELERQYEADVARLVELSNNIKPISPILQNDQQTYDYCDNILSTGEEQYAADTAAINAQVAELKWVIGHEYRFEDPKALKKMQKKHPKLDIPLLYAYYDWAEQQLRNINPRYVMMRTYCNKVFQEYREAQSRTMPTGHIVSLRYEEYGSSRPQSVVYTLTRDSVATTYTLTATDYELREPHTISVGSEVETKVRQLIEQHKIYQEMRRYTTPPSLPDAPTPLGGAAAWEFVCKMEGGNIVSSSDGGTLMSRGCIEVMDYLRSVVTAKIDSEKQ